MTIRYWLALVLVVISTSAPMPGAAKSFQQMFPDVRLNEGGQKFVEALDYKQGRIPLGVGGVDLNVPARFYFLGTSDARRVLVEAWGNPPTLAEGVLGMIFPADKAPLHDTWAAVVTYDEDGYVSDEDAAGMDYAALLKSMQESTSAQNEERAKEGFPAVQLLGWASPPFYDHHQHKLHWAKELVFGDEPKHTLNYDVRALGRKGVLKMNFVAGMDQLDTIKATIPTVVDMPEFNQGSRYEDYLPGADKVAAYGIGGLIAGKVLSKAGLIAIALVFLKKGWIIVVLALGGMWRVIRRFFSPRQE